ncbi:MAG: energy transducer TonB [Hyphomonas sp.]|nr:energy transducer TonB [Hyphomonas sp.]HRX72805.1 energy transducer TonB [Hyphomonas sp.]
MRKKLASLGFALALAASATLAETPAEKDYPSNDLEIIRPPQPSYPSLAALFGLEGMCEVRFDLLAGGSVINVREVTCTHPVFCDAARRGVQDAELRVIDVPGAKYSGERDNIVYPLYFQFSSGDRNWTSGAPCTSDLVS